MNNQLNELRQKDEDIMEYIKECNDKAKEDNDNQV